MKLVKLRELKKGAQFSWENQNYQVESIDRGESGTVRSIKVRETGIGSQFLHKFSPDCLVTPFTSKATDYSAP